MSILNSIVTTGRLLIWSEYSSANKRYLDPILKASGVSYTYLTYEKNAIPAFNINPLEDVVLALGGNPLGSPLQELKNYGLVKKNLTIGSSRGKAYTLPCGVKCLTSYTASIRDTQYDLFVELQCDIQLALRLLTTKELSPPKLDFKWVDDLGGVLSVVSKHHAKWNNSKPMDVAVDLETTGLVAYDKNTWIVTFQVSTDEKSASVVKFDADFQPVKPNSNIDYGTPQNREELLWVQINNLLNDQLISLKGANLKYDLGWIYEKWGMECTNFKLDTLLAGALLDENRSNSLKVHSYIFSPYGGYEGDLYAKYDIAKPHEVPDDVLLPYCGYDTAVCLQVARKIKEELLQPTNSKLLKFYVRILHPAARAYERVERTGVLVDKKYYLSFKKEVEAKLDANLALAHSTLPGRLIAKWRDPKDPVKSISLARAVMIADYMFGKQWLNLKPIMFTPKPDKDGKPKPSTSLDHFLKFKDDPEAGAFVKILQEYKDGAKTLSTYIDGFLKDLRYDNRFHATFFLFKGAEGDADDAGTNCFPLGELILTSRGYLPIQKVRVGDLVVSHTGKMRPVVDAFVNGYKDIYKVALTNGLTLKTTSNHPYLTPGGNWLEAIKLSVGTEVCIYSDIEEWKQIDGWAYEISSWGRVRTIDTKEALKVRAKGRHLLPSLRVTLISHATDGVKAKQGVFKISELVASAFVPNPNKYANIRHINGISWDNCVANLEWFDGVATSSKIKPTKLTTAKVQYVQLLAPEQTYGITVYKDKSHVSGGIVTHNTGRISIKNPALQCLKGDSLVLTDKGEILIEVMVAGYEKGERYKVLTHTGNWRDVVGGYRNGIQPLLRITTVSGSSIECTNNHPWLTSEGFIQAGKLQINDQVWRLPNAQEKRDNPRNCLPQINSYTGSRTNQNTETISLPVSVRENEINQRVEPDSGTYHSREAEKAQFQKDYIKSIEEIPAEETFDLTIDKCHSFIVDKLIVHNTVPKKTKWAKLLRRAYIAPKGYVILSADYCLAGDTMVDTVYGSIPITEVKVGMGVFTITKDKVPVVRTVTDFIDAGELPAWEITLDSGEKIVCSGEHKWLGYDGTFTKTQDMLVGHRMMPSRVTQRPNGYTTRYSNTYTTYKTEHRLVAAWKFGGDAIKGMDVHHIDENKSNNHPDNLELKVPFNHKSDHANEAWLTASESAREKKLTELTDGYQKALANGLNFKGENNPRYGEQSGKLITCPVCGTEKYKYLSQTESETLYCSHECYLKDKASKAGIACICSACGITFKKQPSKISTVNYCSNECRRSTKVVTTCAVCQTKVFRSPSKVTPFCSNKCRLEDKKGKNHKVVSVKPLGYSIPMYCLTVEGEHTFSLSCGVVSKNSQGELRIAADLSKEKNMINAYNKGIDLHAFTGAGVAGIDFDKFMSYNDSGDKELQSIYDVNRQKAKGCIAEGQLVKTDQGEVPIEKVTTAMKVWDGIEWVNHDGVIYQGEKYVMEYQGLVATPDHLILTELGFMPHIGAWANNIPYNNPTPTHIIPIKAYSTAFHTKISQSCYLILGSNDAILKSSTTLKDTYGSRINIFPSRGEAQSICKRCEIACPVAGVNSEWVNFRDSYIPGGEISASGGKLQLLQGNEEAGCGELNDRKDNWLQMSTQQKISGLKGFGFGGSLRCYSTTVYQSAIGVLPQLRGAWDSIEILFKGGVHTVYVEKPSAQGLQRCADRSQGQQWSLRGWELTASDATGEFMQQAQYYTRTLQRCLSGGSAYVPSIAARQSSNLFKSPLCYVPSVRRLFWGGYSSGAHFTEKLSLHSYSSKSSNSGFISESNSDTESLTSYKVKTYDILNTGEYHIYYVNNIPCHNCNFGLLYGMGAEGFQIYAETAYGVKMTLKEAQETREKFFATYPRLLEWHKETKDLAMRQGYIDSPLGRRRHLPLLNSKDQGTAAKELRRSVNSSVQGTLSDFSLWSTAILEKEGVTKEAPTVLMVHDQLIAYLPEDNWEYYAKRYRDVMQNLPVGDFGWKPSVTFEVDVEMGMGDRAKGIPPNLAQLTKAKKLSSTW